MTLTLRAIRPDDESALRAGFASLSMRSRYARFRGFAHPSDAQWKYLTNVDGVNHVALVLVTSARQVVGIGRFVRSAPAREAEVAFTVADAYQRRGLGRTLLDALVPLARERGIDTLVAYASADNAAIARLLLRHGAHSSGVEQGETTFRLSTQSAAA